jgi:head-tail adaptor
MFERTFSFWRRLIGKAPAASSQTIVQQDDRRLWVRYETEVQGNVQLAERGHHGRIEADVRDLSMGGANLLVDRPLSLGQMLSLEFPSAKDEMHTVLACVVRAAKQEDGKWSLGCVFSRELSSADFRSFGAQKVQACDNDQRIWVRFDSEVKATYRILGDPASKPETVQVLNLSPSGIGLLVQPSLETGTLLSVDLLDKTGSEGCTILACVVHITVRAAGDHAVGCNFIRELTEEEMQAIL